jgi:hypothetical protein
MEGNDRRAIDTLCASSSQSGPRAAKRRMIATHTTTATVHCSMVAT